MSDFFRDTPFGQVVRYVTRNRYFQYPEEKDPSIWTRYLDEQKSANLAKLGQTEKPEDGEAPQPGADADVQDAQQGLPQREKNSRSSSGTSSQTRVDGDVNAVSGVKVDSEKGKDVHLVSWYGEDDPGGYDPIDVRAC